MNGLGGWRRRRSPERSRLLLGIGVVTVSVAGLSNLVTQAFFTDRLTVGSNAFTTGTVSLGVSPASAAVTLSAMNPGDTVTGSLVVTNSGTLAERYAVTSTTDASDNDLLAAKLQMTIKSGVTSCTTAGFDSTGTPVYGPDVLGSTDGTQVIGDTMQGAQPGDRVLAAGASETLCVQVALPTTTGNSYQNKTTTATFTFDSEQTVNNP